MYFSLTKFKYAQCLFFVVGSGFDQSNAGFVTLFIISYLYKTI